MLITLAAIGRLKAGPERLLVERYLERAEQTGRALGFTLRVREFAESKAGRAEDRKAQEADALLAAVPDGARLVLLDEHGAVLASAAFAERLGAWRDAGARDVVFAIGGADGHGAAVRARADQTLAFGAMTWPHQIVRLLLAEQIYRATTILCGHPYHRA